MEAIMHQENRKEDKQKYNQYENNKVSDQRSQDQEKIYLWRGKYFDARDEIKELKEKIKSLEAEISENKEKTDEDKERLEELEEENCQLRNQLEGCEERHKAEIDGLKEEHAKALSKNEQVREKERQENKKEIDRREERIKELYHDLDKCDEKIRRREKEIRDKEDRIERLKTQTTELRSKKDEAEEYAENQRTRRKDKDYDLRAALDEKDRLQRRIDRLHDDMKEVKDENRGLRQKNRELQSKVERATPRLEYSLVVAKSLHQADPDQLRVAEMLRDVLVKEGDRVDVKIKELEHITPEDGMLVIVGTPDRIKHTLQQIKPAVPFVVLVVHSGTPDRVTTPGKVGVACQDYHVETLDVVMRDGVLHSADPNRPLSLTFRELVKGHLPGQKGLDIGQLVKQVSIQMPRSLTPKQWIMAGLAVLVGIFLMLVMR